MDEYKSGWIDLKDGRLAQAVLGTDLNVVRVETIDQKKIDVNKLEFWDWFHKNLVYCEDTHSFVHRMFDRNDWETYHDAQHDAFEVIKEMEEEWSLTKKKDWKE